MACAEPFTKQIANGVARPHIQADARLWQETHFKLLHKGNNTSER